MNSPKAQGTPVREVLSCLLKKILSQKFLVVTSRDYERAGNTGVGVIPAAHKQERGVTCLGRQTGLLPRWQLKHRNWHGKQTDSVRQLAFIAALFSYPCRYAISRSPAPFSAALLFRKWLVAQHQSAHARKWSLSVLLFWHVCPNCK